MRKNTVGCIYVAYYLLVFTQFNAITGGSICKGVTLTNRRSFVSCTPWEMKHGSRFSFLFSTHKEDGLLMYGHNQDDVGLSFMIILQGGRIGINVRGHRNGLIYNATVSKYVSDTLHHIIIIHVDKDIFTLTVDDIHHAIQLDKVLPAMSIIGIGFGNVKLLYKSNFDSLGLRSNHHFKIKSMIGCLMAIKYTSISRSTEAIITRKGDITTGYRANYISFYRRKLCLPVSSHESKDVFIRPLPYEKAKCDEESIGYHFKKKEMIKIQTGVIPIKSIAFKFKTRLYNTPIMLIYSAQNLLKPIVMIAISQGHLTITSFNNVKTITIHDNRNVNDYQWHWVEISRFEDRIYVIIDSKLSGVEAITGLDDITVYEFHLGSTATAPFRGKIHNILINGHFINLRNYMISYEFNILQRICWDSFGKDDFRKVKYFKDKDDTRLKIPECSTSAGYFSTMLIWIKNQSALLYPLSDLLKNRIANKKDQFVLSRHKKIELNNDSVSDPSIELDYYSDVMIYVTIGLGSVGIVVLTTIFIVPVILLIKYRNRGFYNTNKKTWLDHIKIIKASYKKVAIGEEIWV